MKTAQTPGPWQSRPRNGGLLIEGKNKEFVGFLTGKPDVIEANAHLVKSAPNLAAKLADLIQYLGQDWDGDSMVEECKQALQEAGQPFEYEADDIHL